MIGGRVERTDLALVAGVGAWAAIDVATHRLGGPAGTAALAMALMVLPLAVRRTMPLETLILVGVGLGIALHQDTTSADADSIAVCALVAVYSCGAHATQLRAWIGLVAACCYAAIAVVASGDPGVGSGDYVFFEGIVVSTWLTGYAIQHQRRRRGEAELRAARAEAERLAAVEEERARIARELHDVVAHAISVIVVQARAGRRVLDDDPDLTRTAFGAIEQAGQGALTEMRRLLTMLRSPLDESATPQPTLRDLGRLTAELGAAGLPVQTVVEGTPAELPAAVDLTAYRIVQEALTNALRHAGPARAVVTVRYGDDDLDLEIRDDGRGAAAAAEGAGLAGVRERVSVFGGEMLTESDAGRGYRVHVRLPLGARRR